MNLTDYSLSQGLPTPRPLTFLCRFLLEPGDSVVLDDPCCRNFHALLRAHRVDILSVPYAPTGPDLDRFEHLLAGKKPRLYITNLALHNPTGATLSPVTAHRVLKLAELHDFLIIEDDIFAGLEQNPTPRRAAFDALDRVKHIGSFSKTLSAAIRCGFIAASADRNDPLVDLRPATSFGGGAGAAERVQALLRNGACRRHITAPHPCLTSIAVTGIAVTAKARLERSPRCHQGRNPAGNPPRGHRPATAHSCPQSAHPPAPQTSCRGIRAAKAPV